MRVTLKEVAERAGVSRSAVSRTFTDGASISDKTRRKVIKAARELDYSPNLLAGSLTTRRTKLIGLVADNFSNPVFLTIFDHFTRSLQERGYRPLLVNLSDETDPSVSVRLLKQYSVDGVIVASSTLPASFAKAFGDAGLPVVHSFGRYSGDSVTHIVGVDNAYIGRLAAQELIRCGYRRLGFLGGPKDASSTTDRLQGFTAAAQAAGCSVAVSFARAYSYDAGLVEMERLTTSGDLAQAYLCGDDILALGAMDALEKRGLRVPRDVGIIGVNDMEAAGWLRNELTTVRQPIPEIIAASIDLVVSLIAEPSLSPEVRMLSCSLVRRKTLRDV